MRVEPFESWKKSESFAFRASWLSQKNKRLGYAEQLALRFMAKGEELPVVLQIELDPSVGHKREDWHRYLTIEAFVILDSYAELTAYIKTFFKRSDFGPGDWEMLFMEEEAPVRLSKSQRIGLLDKSLKALASHSFEFSEELWQLIEPFGDYALELGAERAYFRHFVEGEFNAEDNPLQSLVGESCKVESLAFDADKDEKATLLAEGVLELSGNTVRIADWQQTFDDHDEIFESVPYLEVNIASELLQRSFFFSNLKPSEDDQ